MPTLPTTGRVMIVTGEASGDLHGAHLIEAAGHLDPGLQFFGVGGPCMARAGCEILLPGEELAVMGLVEVLGHLPTLWRAFRRLKKILHGPQRPDVLVLIDFAEFNLLLAAQAKKAGVPVVYYVSPQVWAWRRGRVRRIAAVVDRLAAIFPFEPELYKGLDIDVEYVGHPLLDAFEISSERCSYLRALGLDPDRPVIGLFPGSRKNELKYIATTILQSAVFLRRSFPDAQFLLPVASSFRRQDMQDLVAPFGLPVTLTDGSIYDTIKACDAIITVSGTVTLQIALVGTPMAIVYKMAPLSYAIGKRLIRVPFIGLANIVAGRGVVKEFIQQQATPDQIAREIEAILTNPDYNDAMRAGLAAIQHRMGEGGCAARVARMVSELSRKSTAKERSA
ncbi:lipid-A-disaccharide synthase [Syntrophotalea acetylenica]|uniref:lipid-A-disaccharide synthase n=1 Tax=Syntrophotalea acetylenica TaxID=29542 RepID=UPI002A36C50E|nr:lipid-A-disaccharide synthase [Syntrophotalea acetylenica]MDY0262062.1 lipid-A-disaccharide synthase [Syntrophotalea acetylenica]